MELAKEEKCEFLPFMNPVKIVTTTTDGHISGVEFCRTEQTVDGQWLDDDQQKLTLRADFVISAFGSTVSHPNGSLRYSRLTRIASTAGNARCGQLLYTFRTKLVRTVSPAKKDKPIR